MTYSEWEDINTETLEDMKEKFGEDVAQSFSVASFGNIKDKLREEYDGSVPVRYIELEFGFAKSAKIDEEKLMEYVDKIYHAWFHIGRCGCSHDCCGHTATANYYIMKKAVWNCGEYDLHDYVIQQHNGINY